MATVETGLSAGPVGPGRSFADRIDRWQYVFMASLFIVVILVGFIPDSIGLVAAVQGGFRPPLPPVLHVHAVLMGSWLLLLLTQTVLMATGRRARHMRLGIAGMVLAPAMVITGIILVPTMYRQLWEQYQIAQPDMIPVLRDVVVTQTNFVSQQLRDGISFSLLIGLGLFFRRRDAQTHKRLMILGTAIPLSAGVGRMFWLPTTLPVSPLSLELYMLLLLSPMFVWDLIRLGRIQKAYLIFAVIHLPVATANLLVWGSPWWQAAVPKFIGVAG